MKKNIYRPCPVCRNRDDETITFISHEKTLIRLHCTRCETAFFNRMVPEKPEYDYKYNKAFFNEREDLKADVMSQKIVKLLNDPLCGQNVFEIGVGNGLVLRRLMNYGIPCEGVDVDPKLCEYLSNEWGIRVHPKGLERLHGDKRFDVVYSADVIEHFEEPDHFMLHAKKLMKPRGFLFLNTPNLDCSDNCDPNWHHFRTRNPWEHACILSPRSMKTLAARHDLIIINTELTPLYGSFQTTLKRRIGLTS